MYFTKGHWVADNGDSEIWGIFEEQNGAAIAYVADVGAGDKLITNRNFDEACADARLMAASPDLYKALEAYQKANRVHNDAEQDLYDMADYALRKANQG